jgi:hypothetical protein
VAGEATGGRAGVGRRKRAVVARAPVAKVRSEMLNLVARLSPPTGPTGT